MIDFKKERWETQCHKRAQNHHLKKTFEAESKRLAQNKIQSLNVSIMHERNREKWYMKDRRYIQKAKEFNKQEAAVRAIQQS